MSVILLPIDMLPIMLLNFSAFQFHPCCSVFLCKPQLFSTLYQSSVLCFLVLNMVSEHYWLAHKVILQKAIIHTTWLLVNAPWLALATLLCIPMRNCRFRNGGGVKKDEASLFMPPLASQPVSMVMLCHPLLMLQFCLFPYFSSFDNTRYRQQIFTHVSSTLWCEVCNGISYSFFN